MNFVTHFNTAGVESKQIPCITGSGAPNAQTVGVVGCLYMDTQTGTVYRCTAPGTWVQNLGTPGKDGKDGQDGRTPIKGTDYFTETEKADMVTAVMEAIGCPVFGIVDGNNQILLSGTLSDGTYSVKYEMENGTVLNIGNMTLDTNVYYNVTNTLTNCTTNNSATKAVKGGSYTATITANSGYELKSVTATMGGSAVSVSNGKINITNVTGNIVITAVAEEIKAKYTNLANPSSSDWGVNKRINSSGGLSDGTAGVNVTNFIGPVKSGDIIRVKGMNLTTQNSPPYKSDKSFTAYGNGKLSAFNNLGNLATNVTATTTGGQLTVGTGTDIQNGYWRFSGELNGTANDVIITINEPIV